MSRKAAVMQAATMRIERLQEPKQKGGRWTVFFADGQRLRLLSTVVGDFGLRPGLELSAEELSRLKEAGAAASAKERAVRIISASNVTQKELRRRLVQKGESAENASAAVTWLSDLNLLDDLETAKQLVRSAGRKGYGRARARQILYQKGVDKALWDEALEELPEPDGAIDRFLASRFRGEEPDRREVKRAVDALMRRGHRWEDIRTALRRYTDTLEEGDF